MAKVTITLEDNGSEVDVKLSFEPEIKTDERGTPAQWMALDILNNLQGEDEDE